MSNLREVFHVVPGPNGRPPKDLHSTENQRLKITALPLDKKMYRCNTKLNFKEYEMAVNLSTLKECSQISRINVTM